MIGNRRIVVIIQARRGSTRLPDKVLLKLGEITALEATIRRCRAIPGIDAVICATTENPEDDALLPVIAACGAIAHRGSASDVLARYLGAAAKADADILMRVTGDCPLIDPAICRQVIDRLIATGADYAANNMPRLFPHGLDCEAFTPAALALAASQATDPQDREHVTPWLRRSPAIKRASLIGPGWPADRQRWTLDYPEDYAAIAALYRALPDPATAGMQDILSAIAARPGLGSENAHHRLRPVAGPGAPILLFRIAAGAAIGQGHAMRSMALASQLAELGWDCRWATTPETADFLGDLLPPEKLTRLIAAPSREAARNLAAAQPGCAWAIVDDYDAEPEFCAAFREASGARIAIMDDLGRPGLAADLIVNPTPGFTPEDYPSSPGVPVPRLCLGPDYALLRRQFAFARKIAMTRPIASGPITHLLIAFGGVDPLNATELALTVARDLGIPRIDIVLGRGAPHLAAIVAAVASLGTASVALHIDRANMAELMAECDLVIGAPGTSTFERCALGLPSLLVGIAENQRANAAFLEKSGAAQLAGFLTNESRAAIAGELRERLRALDADPALRQQMAERAARFCDARGVARLALALLPALPLGMGRGELVLRLAETADETRLLDWQRAPETRRFARNPDPPEAEAHRRWLAAKLAADGDWFLIGEIAVTPCGFLRLDRFGEDHGCPQFLISIAAAPGRHGQGIGRALLAGARALAPGAHFYAEILPGNVASLALFRSAGYESEADGYYHSRPRRAEKA